MGVPGQEVRGPSSLPLPPPTQPAGESLVNCLLKLRSQRKRCLRFAKN